MPETPFAETEVLMAIMEDDEEKAEALIEAMTPRERAELRHYGHRMTGVIYSIMRDKGEV